jgi:membrane protein DedA with SNARE-associated domain
VHEITDAVTQWIADYGLYAIFFLSLVDAVLPAASELVMVYAGALAGGAFAGQNVTLFGEPLESTFWAWLAVVVAATTGYVLGSILGWAIGLYGGRPYLERHGRWLHVTPENLDQAEKWFDHYGSVTVFVSRMLPVVRSFISIPAGIAEMPLGRFTALTAAGSVVWYAGLGAIGVAVGASWERFHHAFRYADIAAVTLVVALGVVALWHHRRRRQRRRSPERSA